MNLGRALKICVGCSVRLYKRGLAKCFIVGPKTRGPDSKDAIFEGVFGDSAWSFPPFHIGAGLGLLRV